MNLGRLRPGEWLLAAGAIALVVSLFLRWYGVGNFVPHGWTGYGPAPGNGTDANAWAAHPVVATILFACACVCLLAVVLQATQHSPALPVISSVAAGWASIVALVLVTVKVVDHPRHLEYGAWMALAAAVALLAGAWWAIRDESPGLGVRKSHLESSG